MTNLTTEFQHICLQWTLCN